ncbi:MAG TPA: DinB family protein [Anaerolineales bacterium]|nr:DinB family protein [Anaerolineales bacterium]
MNTPWRTIIWQQFGAAIDDLDNALRACPDELWRARLWHDPEQERFFLPEYWYIVYHTLFWLDLYLTGAEEGFVPPAPFMLIEQDENGPIPERPYTKDELRAYLDGCRKRCQATIEALSDEAAQRRSRFGWGEVSFAELLLYSMRHVQGHAAQLNLLLGQKTGSAPGWVTQADKQS